jgi:hypothetical protein
MNCANHPERERIAFCQNCGKPLCQECTRTVGTAVFCEPCLAAKLAGTGAPTDQPSAGPYPPNTAAFAPGPIPPINPGEPNPGLAALLGFIPGVGAMYNGQYAKGLVHLIVFAVLVSLAHENGIFGLFIAGWVFYQVIEAHHTARARRDGTPLPNPFGLNDLGERLGFGKAWPNTAPGAVPPTHEGTVPPASTYAPPQAGYPPYTSPASNWSNPSWESYVPPVPPVPPGSPYVTPLSPFDPNAPIPRNRFPAGAIWLIALGTLFLVGNAGLFHGFPIHRLIPFFLIGLGVWLFIHKMTGTGATLADDGTPLYRMRLFRALRGSIWVILVGVLFFLASFNILPWSRSWPLFIIVAGLMTFFERTAYSAATAPVYPYPPPPTTPPPPANPTSIVPSSTHDQEGS